MPQKKTTSARSTTRTTKKSVPAQLPHEMVARRAFEIWQAAVHRANQKAAHWTEAESQLRAEMKKSARKSRTTKQTKPATAVDSTPRKESTRLAA